MSSISEQLKNKLFPFKTFQENGLIKLIDNSYLGIIQVFGNNFQNYDENHQNQEINHLADFLRFQSRDLIFIKINFPFDFSKP